LNANFYRELRERIAGLAIGGSTLRNMTGVGGIKIARNFCSREETLKCVTRQKRFADGLNTLTQLLARELPPRKLPGGNRWGPARKILNIFLSDATYNIYLRKRYKLDQIEDALEVPLDSYVAKGLSTDAQSLPRPEILGSWRGVVHTTPDLNARYQAIASIIAKHRGYRCRSHLDLRYWRQKAAG